MLLKRLVRRATRAFGVEIKRYTPEFRPGLVTLRPHGAPRGNVLLAYILEPFQRRPGEPISTHHTHDWESVLIAQVWLDQGYSVDVIDYHNDEFIPKKHYAFFVSARTHLERIAARLNEDCVKIAHLDTTHYAFNNRASYERLRAVQKRRGVSLPESMRLVEPNRAIECADFGVVLGNKVTADTYRYAGKHLFNLEVPAAVEFSVASGKDWSSSRNRFLWLGSGGLVHKGLDIVLEAFSRMPDMHLTVCGPVDSEAGFRQAYHRELFETPNIRTVGWVDIAGADFRRIVDECLAVVYPSCAEAQAGSIINCLRAGLIPVVSREAAIPTMDFGLLLADCSVENIRDAVRSLAQLAPEELGARARRAWEYAVTHHSHEAYARGYGKFVEAIIADTKKKHPAVGRPW